MAETAEMAEILTNGGRCIKMAAAIYVRTKVTNARQDKKGMVKLHY